MTHIFTAKLTAQGALRFSVNLKMEYKISFFN